MLFAYHHHHQQQQHCRRRRCRPHRRRHPRHSPRRDAHLTYAMCGRNCRVCKCVSECIKCYVTLVFDYEQHNEFRLCWRVWQNGAACNRRISPELTETTPPHSMRTEIGFSGNMCVCTCVHVPNKLPLPLPLPTPFSMRSVCILHIRCF